MIKPSPTQRCGWLALACVLSAQCQAAISFSEIQIWAGSGTNQAGLVIDWGDGSAPLLWGYRWDGPAAPTGRDMLMAVVGADARLNVPGLTPATTFVNRFRYDADHNGSYERDATGGSTNYWGYSVNNAVFFHPTNFSLNSHIMPPNGNPYETGSWVGSSTGMADRPLANGSWDGFAYGSFNLTTFSDPAPGLAVPAIPVPEPTTLLGLAAVLFLCKRRRSKTCALLVITTLAAHAGPYAPKAGEIGSTAIAADSPKLLTWASASANLTRGLQQLNISNSGLATYGEAADGLGIADCTPDDPYGVVSLGDGGSMTVTFPTPLGNGLGYDLAVFENSFTDTFLELAFVEVSSNGVNFFRFPAASLTPSNVQVGGFSSIDPTDLNNLAGKYRAGFGTPFDLDELQYASPLLNVNRITHVRVTDVVGSITPSHARRDASDRIINDPFPTPFDSAGFDLDAVGGMNLTDFGRNLWLKRKFSPAELANPSISSFTADPDHDGLTNLMEYASNTDPLTPNTPLSPLTVAAGTGVTLSFKRLPANTDLRYAVEESDNLQSWEALVLSQAGAATTSTGYLNALNIQESASVPTVVSLQIPLAVTGKYYRLRISTL